MTVKELLQQKQKEAVTLNEELKKVEQYRLDLMSQSIKVNGALEVLQQLMKSQEVKPVIAPAVPEVISEASPKVEEEKKDSEKPN